MSTSHQNTYFQINLDLLSHSFEGASYELNLACGDDVDVFEIDESSGWWQGQVVGKPEIGCFPGNFVVPIHVEDPNDGMQYIYIYIQSLELL